MAQSPCGAVRVVKGVPPRGSPARESEAHQGGEPALAPGPQREPQAPASLPRDLPAPAPLPQKCGTAGLVLRVARVWCGACLRRSCPLSSEEAECGPVIAVWVWAAAVPRGQRLWLQSRAPGLAWPGSLLHHVKCRCPDGDHGDGPLGGCSAQAGGPSTAVLHPALIAVSDFCKSLSADFLSDRPPVVSPAPLPWSGRQTCPPPRPFSPQPAAEGSRVPSGCAGAWGWSPALRRMGPAVSDKSLNLSGAQVLVCKVRMKYLPSVTVFLMTRH